MPYLAYGFYYDRNIDKSLISSHSFKKICLYFSDFSDGKDCLSTYQK